MIFPVLSFSYSKSFKSHEWKEHFVEKVYNDVAIKLKSVTFDWYIPTRTTFGEYRDVPISFSIYST